MTKNRGGREGLIDLLIEVLVSFFFAKTYPGYAHFFPKNKTKADLAWETTRQAQWIKIIFIVLTKKKCPKMLHKQQNSQISLSNPRGRSKKKFLRKPSEVLLE